MSAPEGNQFWKLRSKHGRDKLFTTPELMWEAACNYFQWCVDNPMQEESIIKYKDSYEKANTSKLRAFTMEGMCHYLDCNKGYFSDFANSIKDKDDELSKDFSVIITRIREIIYRQKFEGAASGFLNANIIARDLGIADKQDITSKGDKITINLNDHL